MRQSHVFFNFLSLISSLSLSLHFCTQTCFNRINLPSFWVYIPFIQKPFTFREMMNRGLGSGGGSSSGKNQGGEAVVEMFPSGLRVLVVDDDPTCLMILERMLRTCLYEGSKNHKDKIFSLVRFSQI